MTTTTHETTAARTFAGRFLAEARDKRRRSHEARTAHRTLRRELATYTSTADVDDLLAAMRGHDSPENDEIRDLLTSRRTPQHIF